LLNLFSVKFFLRWLPIPKTEKIRNCCVTSAPSSNSVQRYNPIYWTTTILRTCTQ
jgi:hypothetical protein